MAELQNFFDKYTTLSHEELLAAARKSMALALVHLRKLKAGEENELLSAVIATALGADDTVSDDELAFITDLLSSELTRSRLTAIAAKFGTDEMRRRLDRVTDSLPKEGKSALCTLTLCILAADRRITPKETDFLLRLMR